MGTDHTPSAALEGSEHPEGNGTPLPSPRPIVPEDVERGLRFNHQVEHQTRQRLAELSASYYALLETLVARGVIPLSEHEQIGRASCRERVYVLV